jgi:hypothetical protein
MLTTASATCEECGVTVVVTATAGPTEDGKGLFFRTDIRSPFLHQCEMHRRKQLADDLVCPRLQIAAERALERALTTNGS